MQHALMCPQCNAPLKPSRFARQVVCSYCGATVQLDESAVPAEVFHAAFRAWNSPQSYTFASWVSLGEAHWALEAPLAIGETADVFAGRRARWPTELVIVKLLRERGAQERFENEWACLQELQRSTARGAETFAALLPQPVSHGELSAGLHAGRRASLFRWQAGFRHTFEAVRRAHPQGIPPRASIWVWRRILEVLSFVHASGLVHGAVLPPHLLVQDGEHGVRLVGYGRAGRAGGRLAAVSPACEDFYPDRPKAGLTLTPGLDVCMSARCVAAVLGGDPAAEALPEAVPAPLAALVRRVARPERSEDAWELRDELGVLAERLYGAPQFIPIEMPS